MGQRPAEAYRQAAFLVVNEKKSVPLQFISLGHMRRYCYILLTMILLLPVAACAQYHARDCFFIYPTQTWECHPYWILSSVAVGSWADVNTIHDPDADVVMSLWRADSVTIDLNTSTPEWGSLLGGGRVPLHHNVTVAAVPKADIRFVEWSDGVRTNPRQLTADSNITLCAIFADTALPPSEPLTAGDDAEITLRGQRVYISGARNLRIRIFNPMGLCLIDEVKTSADETSYNVNADGTYFIQIGNTEPQKIILSSSPTSLHY